jgi:hypothetical protein
MAKTVILIGAATVIAAAETGRRGPVAFGPGVAVQVVDGAVWRAWSRVVAAEFGQDLEKVETRITDPPE